MKEITMHLKLLLSVFLVSTWVYGSDVVIHGWTVKVINNSPHYYRVLGCFDPLCVFHSDVLTVNPKTTLDMPLPAGIGSCLHHIYYKDDGLTKK